MSLHSATVEAARTAAAAFISCQLDYCNFWYGHVLRKDDDDWVKKCTEYEVEGPRPRGRPGERLSERTVSLVN